jgi:hypothetical protein
MTGGWSLQQLRLLMLVVQSTHASGTRLQALAAKSWMRSESIKSRLRALEELQETSNPQT